jgi:hypothetical protein
MWACSSEFVWTPFTCLLLGLWYLLWLGQLRSNLEVFFEQICSSVFQFTPILRGFFLGQTRLLAAWNWRGSKLSGSFSYFPNSKCTAPCMLKLMWELWIWHFSCWSSCDTMDLTFPFRLTDLQEGGSLGWSSFHSTTVLTHRFWGIQKMSVRIYWGYT